MTTPNAELAYRVLDHIDAHPEEWNQGVYIGERGCGTVACFAGRAVLLSGDEAVFYGDEPAFRDGTRSASGVRVANRVVMVSFRAVELLGASRWVDEGGENERDLFGHDNTREDLGRLVAEIFGPRPDAAA